MNPEKLDILAIGAHPDDVELGCGATISKAISSGQKVGIIDLTRGELGSRGSAEIRLKEAAAAALVLGVKIRVNLEFRDAFFVNDEKHQRELIRLIRRYRPDMVLANAIHDRHIDHGKGASLVQSACFLSGLSKIKTTDYNNNQKFWRPKNVFHYLQWNSDMPDFVVDVSNHINQKIKAVKAYRSQFYDPNSTELQTPISSKNFLDSIRYRAADLGRLSGVDFAEGFTKTNVLTVSDLSTFL